MVGASAQLRINPPWCELRSTAAWCSTGIVERAEWRATGWMLWMDERAGHGGLGGGEDRRPSTSERKQNVSHGRSPKATKCEVSKGELQHPSTMSTGKQLYRSLLRELRLAVSDV